MRYIFKEQQNYLTDFIASLSIERNLSKNTLCAYRCDVMGLLNWCNMRKVEVLDDKAVFAYFQYLQDEIELKAKSIRRKYVALKQYFQFINLEKGVTEIFFRFSSRKFQIPHNLPKTLSLTEIGNLISATNVEFQEASSDFRKRLCIRNMCIIELLFCLGLRIGEVEALDVGDYNREEGSILIRGKGRKERMLFISSPIVSQKLQVWLMNRGGMGPEDSALFVNKYGKRLSIYSIENIFYKYREMAKINPKATPHYMRHSFATQLLNNGAGIRDVQELLGHNSIVTTQIYTEVSIGRKKEVLMKYNGRNFINTQ